MARILLGVSGGISAYKALEFARLATKAGHGVRVLMTPAATRFVGAASFEGIVGAPVLLDEFERDPLRGAFPGDAMPEHDPIGHLAVAGARSLSIVFGTPRTEKPCSLWSLEAAPSVSSPPIAISPSRWSELIVSSTRAGPSSCLKGFVREVPRIVPPRGRMPRVDSIVSSSYSLSSGPFQPSRKPTITWP